MIEVSFYPLRFSASVDKVAIGKCAAYKTVPVQFDGIFYEVLFLEGFHSSLQAVNFMRRLSRFQTSVAVCWQRVQVMGLFLLIYAGETPKMLLTSALQLIPAMLI